MSASSIGINKTQYIVEISGLEIGISLILSQGFFLAAFFSGIWLTEEKKTGPEFMFHEAVAVVLGALLAFCTAYISSTLRKAKGRGATIEDRVRRLTLALEDATRLVGHIEEEIQARTRLAEKLQSDIDVNRDIAALMQNEVEAVTQALRGELTSTNRKSLIYSFFFNFLFFALGFIISHFSQ